jgi:hypothetical protein
MKGRAVLWIGGLLAAATASAQGDFPFGEIPGINKEPSVQIDLNPEMMKLFGGAASGVDPQTAAALQGITNMRVRVYEDIGDEIPDLMKFVNDTTARLERGVGIPLCVERWGRAGAFYVRRRRRGDRRSDRDGH